jgi:hypothetical protein
MGKRSRKFKKQPDESPRGRDAVTRRLFLVGGACATVWGVSQLTRGKVASNHVAPQVQKADSRAIDSMIADFERRFNDEVQDIVEGRVEQREMQLTPEWERTGSDMFITMFSENLGFDSQLGRIWTGILNSMPNGTNIHVMTFIEGESVLLGDLEAIFPHLNFQLYGCEAQRFNGIIYAQDMLFASGKKSVDGRFKAFTGTLDGVLSHDDPISVIKAKGDTELAKKYPDTFELESFPTRLEGGDLQTTILPSGESAIIVGDNNFRILVSYIIEGANKNGRDFQNGNFDYAYVGAKALLKQYFGVDKVVVTDEQDILHRMVGNTLATFVQPKEDFYHVDMISRTAVCPDGGYVAFCTNPDKSITKMGSEDFDYLQRIQNQFASLEYEIELLPCGPYPSLNYTNVLMFTPEGGVPTVMMPFYGLESDMVAALIYEKRGFKVIPVDMAHLLTLSEEDLEGVGSLHCLVETMA